MKKNQKVQRVYGTKLRRNPVKLILSLLNLLIWSSVFLSTVQGCDSSEEMSSNGSMGGNEGDQSETGGVEGGAEGGIMGGDIRGGIMGGEGQLDSIQGCNPEEFGRQKILLNNGARTQIHAFTQWDGDGFWMVWNQPNEEGKFEVWAGRFGCDLNPTIDPFVVDQVEGANDVDPTLAIFEDHVLIAWPRDLSSPDTDYNLTTWTRLYQRQTGEALSDPQQAPFTLNNQTPPGNRWMVRLKAFPSNSNQLAFILAGAWGNPEKNTFQVYWQALDQNAQALGEATLVDERGQNQMNPELEVGDDFSVHLTWQGDLEEIDDQVWARSWIKEDMDLQWQASDPRSFGSQGWVFAQPWFASPSAYPSRLDSDALEQELGSPPQTGHPHLWIVGGTTAGQVSVLPPWSPSVRLTPTSAVFRLPFISDGLISGYRSIGGSSNRVWWSAFQSAEVASPSGARSFYHEQVRFSEFTYFEQATSAAAYPGSVSPLEGGFLVVWSQGNNPEFELSATLLASPRF